MSGFKACQLGCAGSPCVTCMYGCIYGYVCMNDWVSKWVTDLHL